MSITDVPPEYAVLTFGCAECGGGGEHEDSESEGVDEAGPEVLETGLLPVPGRLLKAYKKKFAGGDTPMDLNEFYEKCWNILESKNRPLWDKKYGRDTARAVLAMVAYVDVCIQKVVKNTRLSLSTKAAFDKDSNKKNLVRDISGNIKLNENGFYFGLTTYLQQQASYLCWANKNKEKAEKGKKAILNANLTAAVAVAELSISLMTRENDLDGFYFFVHEELRQGVSTFEIYENEAKNKQNPDQDWMGNLSEEEKENASSLAYAKMNEEIMFSKEDADKITTLIIQDNNITPMKMLMKRGLSSETMLQPERSLNAGVMLWNVFVFYAEHAKQNAPKPARDWKSWFPSRGRGASKASDTIKPEPDDTVQGLTTQIKDLEEALKERNEKHEADVDSLQTIQQENLELVNENEKLKLNIESLKKELEEKVREFKLCMKSNENWARRDKTQAEQHSISVKQLSEQLKLKQEKIDAQKDLIAKCMQAIEKIPIEIFKQYTEQKDNTHHAKQPRVLPTRPSIYDSVP